MTRRSPPPALLPLLQLVAVLATLQALTTPAAAAPTLMRLCGSQLADTLREECRGRGYNDPLAMVAARTSSAGAPSDGISRGRGGGGSIQTRALGVADACCYRGCTRRDLQQYCSPMDPRRSSGPGSAAPAPAPAVVAAPPSASALSSSSSPSGTANAGASGRDLPMRTFKEKRPAARRAISAVTVAAPAPRSSFRVGIAPSYYSHFVLPPAIAASSATDSSSSAPTVVDSASTAATAG